VLTMTTMLATTTTMSRTLPAAPSAAAPRGRALRPRRGANAACSAATNATGPTDIDGHAGYEYPSESEHLANARLRTGVTSTGGRRRRGGGRGGDADDDRAANAVDLVADREGLRRRFDDDVYLCVDGLPSPANMPSELQTIGCYSELLPGTVDVATFNSFARPKAAILCASFLRELLCVTSCSKTARVSSVELAVEDALDAVATMSFESMAQRVAAFTDECYVRLTPAFLAMVPGRVSIEVDSRHADDAVQTVEKVVALHQRLKETHVPMDRVLFRIFANWEGIEAVQCLEEMGIRCHLTPVHSLAQAVAAHAANASAMSVFAHPSNGGTELARRVCCFLRQQHSATKVIAQGLRSREDVLALSGCDYLIVPPHVMREMNDHPTAVDEEGLKRLHDGQRPVRIDEEMVDAEQFTDAEMRPAESKGELAGAMSDVGRGLLSTYLEFHRTNSAALECDVEVLLTQRMEAVQF